MQEVTVVSDLHLFCRRSKAEEHLDAIHAAARTSDRIVLNGDIFDFRWSVYPTIEETAKRAVDWLHAFVLQHDHCTVDYVLGNHDSVHCFVELLDRLSGSAPNLTWRPDHLRIGDAVFLHGDVAHRPMTADDLADWRARCALHRRRGEVWNRAWDALFRVGAHKAIAYRLSPTEKVTRHLHHYLEEVGEGPTSGTRRVYFGHTHVPVYGVEHRGVAYYNGGAPMPGLRFEILRTQVETQSAAVTVM